MHSKPITALGVVVALSGGSLAAFIPTASAAKPHASQSCSYTEYSEYSQYCEPQTTTTVVNGTTTVNVSPGFTISSASPAPGTASAPTAAKAGIVVSADGGAAIDVSKLTVGEKFSANGVAVVVLAKTADGVEMSFGGVAIDVPSTAAVSISADGTVTVTYFETAGGELIPAFRSAHAAGFKPVAAVGQQDIILPAGKTSQKFRYSLNKGVSFGKTTWAQVAKVYTIQATGKHALRSSLKPAKLANVSFDVAANKTRNGVTVKLAKAQSAYVVKFNVGKLQYTKAEQTKIIRDKITTLSPRFTVVSTKATKTSATVLPFTYPVS